MKNKKIFHCRTSKTGPTRPVTVKFTKYQSNNRLAVQLVTAKAPWSEFATITVNLPTVPEELLKMWFGTNMSDLNTLAFVDTNNCPWAEEFLKDNNIAEDTRISMPSGFCNYPLYKFNLDAQWE